MPEKLEWKQKGDKMHSVVENIGRPDRRPELIDRAVIRKRSAQLLCGLAMVGITAVLTHLLSSEPTRVFAQPQTYEPSREGLITHTQTLPDGTQQLCVLDPRQRVVAVYHIDVEKGGISLQSVRNIYWDLRINHFNGTTPLPEEIRSLIEQE